MKRLAVSHSSPAGAKWREELRQELRKLEDSALLRRLYSYDHAYIDFSSNDYLSLNSSGRMLHLLEETLQQWRQSCVGSTASRLLSGHHESFTRLEENFAKAMGYESALFFSSGYLANVGVLPAILNAKDLLFADRLCHASILDGIRLAGLRAHYFRHNDCNDLEAKLKRYAPSRSGGGRIWILSESLFSMDGDSPDLPAMCDLANAYEACMYLDEAHALGVRGGGKGLAAEYGLRHNINVSVFPCGKAPGLCGALVCGPKELKDFLANKARSFLYSTALPPFFAELLDRSLTLILSREMNEARSKLCALSSFFRGKLASIGLSTGSSSSHIIPLMLYDTQLSLALAEACQQEKMDLRAIRPPSVPRGQSRVRVSLQAAHSYEDLERLYEVCLRCLKEWCNYPMMRSTMMQDKTS